MAEEQGAERTEEATPRRREEAAKQGNVPRSAEVPIAASMLLLVGFLGWMLPGLARRLLDYVRGSLALLDVHDEAALPGALLRAGEVVGVLLLPVAGAAAALGVLLGVAQVGPSFHWELLELKWERLDPRSYLDRLISWDLPLTLGKSLLKGVGVVSLAVWTLRDVPAQLAGRALLSAGDLAQDWRTIAQAVVSRLAMAVVSLALLDVVVGRLRHEARLRMTRQEVKDEMKEAEGNPQMKAAMRRRAREQSKKKLVQAVKEATVVATNPTHYAVALRYRRDKDPSPRVTAKGADHRALRIRELAREFGIPIIEDKPLARTLYSSVKEGQTVPVELYRAVARLLAVVYRSADRGAARRAAR